MKIGDKVKVISGDEKGKEAKIVRIDRKLGRACLEGIGIIERHMKKSYTNPKGGKKTIHVGIHMSNLKVVEAAKPVKADKADKSDKSGKKKLKKGAK
ncbi:50S ribosomal protein L24 [Candidatus Saccharibacteria bacterium]|nr:50S ribosomal protein L24 [Candidatus Saccharibacteria bacterium]